MAFKEILKKAQDGRQLVSLFFDPENWDSFALGYVDKLDETHIRLHSLDRYGRFSGYEVRELGDIIKLEMGGHYENKVARFHSAKSSELFKEVIIPKVTGDNIVLETLKLAQEEVAIVTAGASDFDNSITGYVNAIHGDLVTFKIVDSNGCGDGISIVRLDQIKNIDFNTIFEQSLDFLYRSK